MSDEMTLLPCPFCGGQPDFQRFNITPNVQGRIICSCGIELRQGKNDTEDDMRIIWNTRSDYDTQRENELRVERREAERICRIAEYADAPMPVCSECGAVQPDDFTVYYCWNCGAKVVGE